MLPGVVRLRQLAHPVVDHGFDVLAEPVVLAVGPHVHEDVECECGGEEAVFSSLVAREVAQELIPVGSVVGAGCLPEDEVSACALERVEQLVMQLAHERLLAGTAALDELDDARAEPVEVELAGVVDQRDVRPLLGNPAHDGPLQQVANVPVHLPQLALQSHPARQDLVRESEQEVRVHRQVHVVRLDRHFPDVVDLAFLIDQPGTGQYQGGFLSVLETLRVLAFDEVMHVVVGSRVDLVPPVLEGSVRVEQRRLVELLMIEVQLAPFAVHVRKQVFVLPNQRIQCRIHR